MVILNVKIIIIYHVLMVHVNVLIQIIGMEIDVNRKEIILIHVQEVQQHTNVEIFHLLI